MKYGKWQVYGKSIIMFVALLAVAIRSAVAGDGHVSAGEAVQIVTVGSTAAMTWLVPNFPGQKWLKPAAIAIGTVATVVASTLSNWQMTGDEWVNVAIAIVAAVVGIAAPSKSDPEIKRVPMYPAGPRAADSSL